MADRDLRIRVLLTALDKVSAPFQRMSKSLARAREQLGGTREELTKLQRAQRSTQAATALGSKLDANNAKLDTQRRKVRELSLALQQADQPTKALARSMAAAQKAEARLAEKSDQLATELRAVKDQARSAGVDVSRLADEEKRLAAAMDTVRDRVDEQRGAMKKLEQAQKGRERFAQRTGALADRSRSGGASMLGGAAALLGPITLAAKSAMNFEDAMADVRKVVTLSDPEFAALGNRILDLSKRVPLAADGIARITALGGRSQVGKGELARFAEDAAKMGVAFDMSAEDAGQTMATWRTAFQLTQEGARTLGDQINALTNRYGGNVAAVTAMTTRIGPLGKVAGATSAEIAAMAALMNAIGIEEEVGATGIKNTLLALTKGTSATKAQKKAMQSLGLEATAVARAMQVDASGTIVNVMERIARLPVARQTGMLDDLFGSESIAAIAPLLTNLPQLRERLALVGNSAGYAGSMMREFDARMGTTSAKLALASNRVEAMKVRIGDILLPIIERIATKVGVLAERFSTFAQEHPGLVKMIAILGAIAAVLGTLLIAASIILAPMALLGTISATIGIGMLPLLAIIIAVAAAVAGLTAAGIFLYNHWGAIVAWFKTVPQVFMSIGSAIINGLVNAIRGGGAAVWDAIKGLAGTIVGGFKGLLGIHSPSRVFASLGGFLTQGLANGVVDGSALPVQRVRSLAGQMTTALAIGAAPALGAGSGTSGSARSAGGPVTIHIHQQPGEDADRLAQRVAAALDRRQSAAQRSSYED